MLNSVLLSMSLLLTPQRTYPTVEALVKKKALIIRSVVTNSKYHELTIYVKDKENKKIIATTVILVRAGKYRIKSVNNTVFKEDSWDEPDSAVMRYLVDFAQTHLNETF